MIQWIAIALQPEFSSTSHRDVMQRRSTALLKVQYYEFNLCLVKSKFRCCSQFGAQLKKAMRWHQQNLSSLPNDHRLITITSTRLNIGPNRLEFHLLQFSLQFFDSWSTKLFWNFLPKWVAVVCSLIERRTGNWITMKYFSVSSMKLIFERWATFGTVWTQRF